MIYLSRDSFFGHLAPGVTVWSKKPRRVWDEAVRGYCWVGANSRIDGYEDQIFCDVCVQKYGVKPDTDLELIRVGSDFNKN